MQSFGMPWPGDEGQQRWEQAWFRNFKVWASKWNGRAYFSTRKVKLDHDLLCMAVLVEEIINADYAFVIHTTNPSTGDPSEIYAAIHYITFRRKIITFRKKIMTGVGKSLCNYPN